MKNKAIVIGGALASCLLLMGATILGYQDWQLRGSAPGNPASGFLRTWADNTAGAFKCLTSAGAGCYWSTNYAGTYNTGILPVANGGTGTATPSLVAGSNVTITGSWPNQTIAGSGGGGGGWVTTQSDVTASRSLGTVFQNTGTTTRLIYVSGFSNAEAFMTAFSNSSNPPTLNVGENGSPTCPSCVFSVVFPVLPGDFYKVTITGGTPGIVKWIEWN